jgi:DMSO/TMAO reductase YedYZ molybdopterin-dependent catalytic subunit
VSSRRTNVAILWLTAGALATGVLAFGVGSGWNVWVTSAHGLVGLALLALVPWKSVIARKGWARERRGRMASAVLTGLIGISVVAGVVHATGSIRTMGFITAMQVHVATALAALPLVVWHVRVRPARLRRTDMTRRDLVRAGGVLGVGAVLYGATRIPSDRRFTGSHERGSFLPEVMPVTQWFNDSVPEIGEADWRLRVGDREWSYEELMGFEDGVTAVLDCTGGWFARQHWEGVWLRRLLGTVDGASLQVVSATGYARRFPMEEGGRLLIATRVGGAPLSAGHGFPARIVAPGRRGFWWVKWVTEVRTDDRPWWLQPPFPLT